MRSIQQKNAEITERGVRVVAISVDPVETTRAHIEKQGFTYTFLSDVPMEVIKKYDLLHAAGFKGNDIARPAEFLVDPTGKVRWANLTENYRVRAKGEEILKVLDELGVKASADETVTVER